MIVRRDSIALLLTGVAVLLTDDAGAAERLWDNGPPDWIDGFLHSSDPVRSALDDVVIPEPGWTITGLYIEGARDVSKGIDADGFELRVRSDEIIDGVHVPGAVLENISVVSVTESFTAICIGFWCETETEVVTVPHPLAPGRYWLEMRMISDEPFAQLGHQDVTLAPAWAYHEDLGGLMRSEDVFGFPYDTCFDVFGHVSASACVGDIDGDETVGFTDVLAILAAWGPCLTEECPEDLTGNLVVDFQDLLLVLSAWGPCA